MTTAKTTAKPKTSNTVGNVLTDPIFMRDRIKVIDVTQEGLTKERQSLLHALATLGFVLIDEPVEKASAPLPHQQWEKGDIVRCAHTQDRRYITAGKEYTLLSSVGGGGDVEIQDDDGDSTTRCFGIFEWVRRP